MHGRDDALVQAAAAVILRIHDAALQVDGLVATVGEIDVEPGAGNVIPGAVASLRRRPRAGPRPTRRRASPRVGLEPGHRAKSGGDERDAAARRSAPRSPPVTCQSIELPSGAGHDAGILAAAGVDAGMLFVRSLNGGVSHSPDELSSEEDVALAIDVLAGALRRLAAA